MIKICRGCGKLRGFKNTKHYQTSVCKTCKRNGRNPNKRVTVFKHPSSQDVMSETVERWAEEYGSDSLRYIPIQNRGVDPITRKVIWVN